MRNHQLCQPPQKLRLTSLRTLRRSHQQTSSTLHSPHRPEDLILIISRPTCTTYFLITNKFYQLYMYLLIFPHRTPKLLQANAIAMAPGPFLCMHTQDGAFSSPQREGIQSSREACPWHGAHLNSTLKPMQNAKLTG